MFRNVFSILPMLDTGDVSIANRLTVSDKIILTACVCDEHTVGTAPLFSNSGLANPSLNCPRFSFKTVFGEMV